MSLLTTEKLGGHLYPVLFPQVICTLLLRPESGINRSITTGDFLISVDLEKISLRQAAWNSVRQPRAPLPLVKSPGMRLDNVEVKHVNE